METALLIFPCLALICAPAIILVLGRPRLLGTLNDNTNQNCGISIIIPARDEEHNIGKLLRTINSQSLAPLETIVVNDGSTDNTAEIARELGATVIDSNELPEGWNGKPWACHQGAEAAKGDWFLFLDADTTLTKDAVKSFHAQSHDSDKVYSVCPYHSIEKPYEELSAFFNVMMLAGSNAFGTKGHDDPALFGQCMLISREHYTQSGGHAAVKNQVLENFHLSAKLKSLGIQCRSYMGKQTVSMRMFPSGFCELWASWQKGFSGGAANAAPRALLWSSVWISGLMMTIVSLGLLATAYTSTAYFWLAGAAYALGVIQCLWAFRWAGSFSIMNALLFPISLIFYQVLFFSSLWNQKRGKQTQWKGREV
ncbi:MAG: glycosyltransferase family 2 protein [Akkermansiaceae bacterium]